MTRRLRASARTAVQPSFGPVTVVRPNPAVWAEALKRAGGNVRRLRVLPSGDVVVANGKESER